VVSFIATYVLGVLLGVGVVQSFYLAIVGGLLGALVDFDHVVAVALYPGGLAELFAALGRGDYAGMYVILCGSDGVCRYPMYTVLHPILLGVIYAIWIIFVSLPWMHVAIVLPIHFFCDFRGETIQTSSMAFIGGVLLIVGVNIILRSFL